MNPHNNPDGAVNRVSLGVKSLGALIAAVVVFFVGEIFGMRSVAAMSAERLARSIYETGSAPPTSPALIAPQSVLKLKEWNSKLGSVTSYRIVSITQEIFGIPTLVFVDATRGGKIHHELVIGDGVGYVSEVEEAR